MDTPMGNTGFGSGTTPTSSGGTGSMSSASSGYCPTCGQSRNPAANSGLEQFLGRLGISDEMITNLKTSIQNVDVEEYLNTAREYLKGGSEKATNYAKSRQSRRGSGCARGRNRPADQRIESGLSLKTLPIFTLLSNRAPSPPRFCGGEGGEAG
jgi:hypothetical protein